MVSTLLLGLLAVAPFALCVPRPQGEGSIPAPTVNNMTMFGTGCPIGAGGISQVSHGGTPVFAFREWGLSLPNTDTGVGTADAASKWCNEEIWLGNGPVGMRLRIAAVTVSGWAQLDSGTKISLSVETKMGDVVGGKKTLTIGASDLKSGVFEVELDTEPTTIWSACVPSSGDVPHLTVKTTVGLVGTKSADGSVSKGVLGGDNTDLTKALKINFRPAWDPCTS